MQDAELRPNLNRFVNITHSSHQKETEFTPVLSNEANTEIYQPPHLNPVFYEDKKKSSSERAKVRAARFILEDTDMCEYEDLPKEIYFGSHGAEEYARTKLEEKQRYEEEHFVRLKVTKQEKRMNRTLLSGGLADTSSRVDHMRILLQSSDEEMDYKPPPTKKKKKKLKRLRNRKRRIKKK